jgi:hypothetical protein
MIAYHYPPCVGSSGVHRAHKFSRYLPENGWLPTVLTVNPGAHPRVGNADIPQDVRVERAVALDTARHLSVRGIYPRWLALPDRWITWWPAAVAKGLRLIRRQRPDVIWSTFPIATAHLIGLTLHRLTGIPWIADFRDPMTEQDPVTGIEYPTDPAIRRVNGWIERPSIRHCARAVFTTPGTAAMYAARFPTIPSTRWSTIANGYDEEDFLAAEATVAPRAPTPDRRLLLVHSGVLYSDARDPRPFFAAVSRLRREGAISAATLKIVLRASGHEGHYAQLLREQGIEDIVHLEPAIPHREALAEMLLADGLLIFQAASCNWQIPAKLYECMRAMRPILALTDVAGDTAQELRSVGVDTIVPLDDEASIRAGLLAFMAQLRENRAPVAGRELVARLSRRSRTRELADVLDAVAGGSSPQASRN